jgi:tRNA (cytidine/uridine-2'-O-)-methyltransferase
VFHIALYEPEIPPNTGNIIRLCANSGAQLHLIHPLGFKPDDKQLQRAGLDYHIWAQVKHYEDYQAFLNQAKPTRLFAFTTRAQSCYSQVSYQQGDTFLFGPETRGLPAHVLTALPAAACLRIPMQSTSRSLNLSNAVAVVVYEAWRQQGFL